MTTFKLTGSDRQVLSQADAVAKKTISAHESQVHPPSYIDTRVITPESPTLCIPASAHQSVLLGTGGWEGDNSNSWEQRDNCNSGGGWFWLLQKGTPAKKKREHHCFKLLIADATINIVDI